MELPSAIEAVLFYQAEPISVKRLSGILARAEDDIREALRVLEERLSATGLRLLRNGDEVTLGTSPEASALIEAITKEELSRELSKATLETLSIVLYKGPVTRAEIDHIRGVNSTFTLRNLLIRGLIEKIDNPKDQRSFLYKPTFQLLEFMGVENATRLPQYEETLATLASFVAEKDAEGKAGEDTSEKETMTDATEVANEVEREDTLEADILEEDEAGGNFHDTAIHEHTENDEQQTAL